MKRDQSGPGRVVEGHDVARVSPWDTCATEIEEQITDLMTDGDFRSIKRAAGCCSGNLM